MRSCRSTNANKIFLNGNSIETIPIHLRSNEGLGYLPQQRSVFNMTVYDNIMGIAQISIKGPENQKAITEKYGAETIQHPKKGWNDEKEKEYLEDLRGFYKYEESGMSEEEEINGVFIPKKLITKNSKRSCPVCNVYSFKSNDDVYMSKFDCCEKCYIQWIEGREERWKKGWRPKT